MRLVVVGIAAALLPRNRSRRLRRRTGRTSCVRPAQRRQLRQRLRVQPPRLRRPDRGATPPWHVPQPHLRRNATTNAFSTLGSLRAAHHVPPGRRQSRVLGADADRERQPRRALGATIYYRRRTLEVRAFPPGFRLIAGNAAARLAAGPAGDVLELRRSVDVRAVEHRAVVPGGADDGASASRSRAAGTGGARTAPTTRATRRTRGAGNAPRRTPSRVPALSLILRYRRSHRARASSCPQSASSRRTRTSSTRGTRASSHSSSTAA